MPRKRESKPGNEEEGRSEKKRRSPLLILIIFIVLVAGIGAGYFYLSSRGTDGEKPPVPEQLPLADITVNLADPGLRRYLRVSMVLEYGDKKTGETLATQMPRVRDAIITLLSSKAVVDLDNREEKDRLKIELVERINAVLAQGKIEAIFFNDFIIQ